MALEALRNRRLEDVGRYSWRKGKRSKHASDDEFLAGCLVALARSGGDASSFDDNSASKSFHPPAIVNSYKCSVCDKAFPSHQALGGHKASHRIKQPTAAADNGKPSTSTSTSEASYYTYGPHPTGGLHQCTKCGQRFSTGQALGGHMRKHFGGVTGRNIGPKIGGNFSDGGNGTGSGVVTSFSDSGFVSYSNGYGNATPRPRNFDLNLALFPELDLTLKL